MKKILRNILFGDIPVSEYSTVTIAGQIHEKVFLTKGSTRIDISFNHWLLCLDPVIFGIWFSKSDIVFPFKKDEEYKMQFIDSEKRWHTVANVSLEFFDNFEEPDGNLLLFKHLRTRISHINFIKTRLLFYRYYKKPEQNFNILKSFSAAYSYPRRVRLISFKEEGHFNLFPMDLVGDIPDSKYYVFGLRHSNVTLSRIIESKKLVVSELPFGYKDLIYQLGKHHRGPVATITQSMEFKQTEQLGFPVPVWVNSYKEIHILRTMKLGSHMLLWGEEINEVKLSEPTGHLYHIHFLHYLHQKNKGLNYPMV